MRRYGLKGHLPASLQNFLQGRLLVVRIGGAISKARIVQNGVPQGSVLNVTLFLIAINEIGSNINFPLTYRLFADDFSISIQSSNPQRVHRLLQENLKCLSIWSDTYGFRSSPQKTRLVIFRKCKPIPILSRLFLNGTQIAS